MLLVTGGTGYAGSQVVQALLERGQTVRAFVRDPDKARGLFGDAVELAIGDFADPRSVLDALDGVEQLFLSGADDPRRVEWETNVIDAAADMGVRRIVKLSSIAAEPGLPVAFWDWHGRIEHYLRHSRISSVALRSSFYMSNLLAAREQIVHEGRIYAPAGNARIAMLDPRDLGHAAAAVLTSDGHAGRTYVLTGPEAITYAQVAAELSAATGRDVEFVDVPEEAAKQAMIRSGLPDFLAEGIVDVFAMTRRGADGKVTATVESLTGATPRDFASFARDHAHLFIPSPPRSYEERAKRLASHEDSIHPDKTARYARSETT
jgi:uncharacterized protein YbjT (DUF2867 family)